MPDSRFKIMTSAATSGPGDAGRTGSWRVERPVIDYSRCTPARTGRHACHLCWFYCPDVAVSKTIEPQFDLDYCKGCGICAEECPVGAITMVAEETFAEGGADE
ncbi:pyruvate ferredoxin oxidoreductase delta subunit [Geothermobacter ehrlichii]|uniref:Pyruvate ferredoxin oxidoreductase delta subunit n=1 Tax=Geothermobacter ehrlichii TaxID=213224 RepID=A0A5D3WES0_9BACT|nr:4Fe-4S binding protein [Geothermobacter ehrlichii]TYO95772.1 pyruvate ferredoxin oxidoreductase delta subunit [Geothermobacter ehrlichii]